MLCQLSYTHHILSITISFASWQPDIFNLMWRKDMTAIDNKSAMFKQIPSVDFLLETTLIKEMLSVTPRPLVVRAIRQVLANIRGRIEKTQTGDEGPDLEANAIVDQIVETIAALSQPSLRHVINATGVIVHTNLGRSPLSQRVVAKFNSIAGSYSNLEYDLATGKRGSRYVHVEEILRELTGAEDALVVNNNAAAVLIALDTVAKDKEVIISRGQLVEIGGSFRMPDVMKKSGAKMVEVGTTNKTTLKDYESVLGPDTALFLRVHTSNFRIVGFTEEVSLEDLVALGKKHGLPVMEDLGSGCLIDFSRYGLRREPTVQDSVATGADVITFSGDKLLGGPQCGIIIGKKALISAIKANQLNRALRVDKLTILALQETLSMYRNEERAIKQIPTLRMLCQSYQSLRKKAERLVGLIGKIGTGNFALNIVDGMSRVGGGAMPLEEIPSRLLCIAPRRFSTQHLTTLLRSCTPPIIARLEKDQLLLDVRTIQDKELKIVAGAIKKLSTQKS